MLRAARVQKSEPLTVALLREGAARADRCILCLNTIGDRPGSWESYLEQFRKLQFIESVALKELCSSMLGIFSKLSVDDFSVNYVKICCGIEFDDLNSTKICNACVQKLTTDMDNEPGAGNFDLDVLKLTNSILQRRQKTKVASFRKCMCNGCNKLLISI